MDSQASTPLDADLDPLRERVQRAQQFATWTGAAYEQRASFAPQVVVSVMRDYLGKWDALLPELRQEALRVSEERRRQQDLALHLEEISRSVEAQVDELRLRHVIGELGLEDFAAREAEVRSEFEPAALEACRGVMARIDELLAQVGAVQSRMAEAGRWLAAIAPSDAPPPPSDPEPSIVVEPPPMATPPVPPPAPAPQTFAAPLTPPEPVQFQPPVAAPAPIESTAPSTTAPSLASVPAPAAAPLMVPLIDELGEDAYREGGASGDDEWDVPQSAAPPILRAGQQAEAEGAVSAWSATTASTSLQAEDMLATGMLNPRADIALEGPSGNEPPVQASMAPELQSAVPGEGPRLLVFPPEGKEVLYPFNGDVMSMGRGRNNDIQIKNDGKISRYHCRIFRRGDEFIIEDNKSSNGTLVDGKLITRQRLEGGENVQIGETRMVFQL